MKEKILMVTASNDLTCDYLITKFPEIPFFRFNVDLFSKYEISVTTNGFLITNESNSIDSQTCKSIYYRKPTPENLNNIIGKNYHTFAHKEAYSLMEGIVESFDGRCLSKPSIMRKANNKVVQLGLARKLGFNIPKTTITNSGSLIETATYDIGIVKPLSVGTVVHDDVKEFVQTNIIDQSIDKSSLKYSPAYFQEYINKDYELRSTFVGRNAYTVRIDSKNKIDWRKRNNEIKYSKTCLPDELHDRCLDFMDALDMQFGCFDFIVKDETHYFLEMNANGQWAWLEIELGIEISKGIMDHLNG